MKLGDSLGRSRGRRRGGKGGDDGEREDKLGPEVGAGSGDVGPEVGSAPPADEAGRSDVPLGAARDSARTTEDDVMADGAAADGVVSGGSGPGGAASATSSASTAGATGKAARAGARGKGSPGGERRRKRASWSLSRRVVVASIGLVVVGWVFGYALATRVVFPAPPPPGDLFDVPDLRGLGMASVTERLAGVGLTLGSTDSLQHPTVAAGLVLGQSPLPGQVAQPGAPVWVTLSVGPQTRSVPDVVSLDESRARVVLETSGFFVDVDTVEAEAPRGRVIEVSPPPDSVVALPAQVVLVVSTGPPVVPMPFVLGLEQAEVEILLDSLGLVVADVEEVFRFGRDQGIVVEQEPAADTELRRGSSVRLKVGRRGLEREQ